MNSAFESTYRPDDSAPVPALASHQFADPYLSMLLAKWGGTSFNRGIYRLVAAGAVPSWNVVAERAFPSLSGQLSAFGIDWLGRLFALDFSRRVEGRPAVVMLEPGTGEALQIPCNVETFHENELIEYQEEALAASFFQGWLSAGGKSPNSAECIGYCKPLFLGGSDSIDNLELTRIDVYWGISTQLIQQVRGLQVGVSVSFKLEN